MDFGPNNWYPEPVPTWNLQTPTIFVPPSPTLVNPTLSPPPHGSPHFIPPFQSPSIPAFIPNPAAVQIIDAFTEFRQTMDECFNDFRADIGKVQERLRERGRLIKELRSKVSSVATTPGPRYAPEDPTLPRPWRGLIDGSTGSLYYWNTATNQTQYERPCEQAWTTHPQYPPTLPSSECPVHSNTPPYNPDFPPLTHPTQPVYLHRKQLRGFRRRVSRTATQRLFKATRKPDVLWSVGTYSRSKVNRKHRLWVIKAQNDDVFSEIMEELCQLSMVPKAPVDTSQLTATNPSSLPLISKVLEQKEVLYSMAASALAGEIEKPRQALSVTDAEDGSWDDSAKVLLSTSDGSCSHSDLSYQIHSHTSDATNVEIAISNVIGLHKPEAVDIHGFISGEADACSNSSIVRQKTVAMRKKMKELISKPEFSLGVYEPRLVSYVSEVTKIPCQNIEFVLELLREARLHFDRFIKDLSTWNFKKSHLGLSHCYRIINATANGEFLIASGTPHILVDTLKAILLEFEKHLNFEISAGDYCYWKLSLPLSAWFENIQWSDEQVLGADDHFQNYELPKLLLTYLTSSNCFVVYTLLLHESLSGIPKSYHSVLALQLGFSLTWHIYSMATINLLLLLVRVVKWPNQNSSYVPVIDATHVLLQGAAIGFVLVVVPNMYHACSDNDFTRHLGIVIAYPQLNFEGEKSSKTMTEALEVVETPRNGQQFQVLAVFIIRQPITLLQWVYLRTLDNATLSNALCLAPTCTDSAQLLTHRVMIPMLLQLHSYLHELGLRTHMHELDYLFMTSWAYIVRTLPLSVTTMCMADITRGNPSLLAVVVFHFHCQCQPWGSFVDKVIASVNNISELSFLRVTESSTFYSPFYALVRKLLPLSPMAAIQLLGSLLANILRDDDHYIIGILVLNSIIQLVSLKPTQLGLAINYGAIWNGNYCSHESCSIYSPEFMDTWVIEFGCITINFGYLALIPSRHFSLPMRSMEALLLPLLLTIMHCQIRELGNSKYSANSTSQVSIHLCAIVHTWQVKDDGIASSAARTKIKDLKLIYSTLWGLPLFTGVMLNGVPRLGYLYLDYLVGLSYGDDVSMIDIIVAALCGKSIAFIEFHVKMQGVETTFLIWVLASSKHILASHIANQMVGFAELYEKSTDNELESWVVSTTNLVIDALTTHTTLPLVTMDIYVMYKTVMFHLLQAKSSKVHAFGTAVVPGAIYMRLNGTAYMVSGCCRDIAPNWLSKSQVVQFCNISDAWLLSSLLIKSSSTILLLVNLLILTFSSGNLDFQLEDEWVKTPQEKRCSSFLIYEESGIVGYVADLQEKQLHALIIGTSLVSNVGDGATPPARLLTDTVQASQAWLLAGKAFSLVTSLIPCALLISLTQVISTIAAAFAQFISAVYRHINDKTSTHIAAFKILSHPSPHYHLLDFCTGYGRRFSLGDKSVFEGVELLGPYLVTWAT